MNHIPTNAEVAAVFDDIADILEAQNENPFKVRAYRHAVQSLQSLSEPVAAVDQRGELQTIPGFGEAIAAKTREILATGTCELYERLRGQTPPPAEAPEAADIPSPW